MHRSWVMPGSPRCCSGPRVRACTEWRSGWTLPASSPAGTSSWSSPGAGAPDSKVLAALPKYAAQHERDVGGTLAEAAHEIGKPLPPERHVDAHAVALGDQ